MGSPSRKLRLVPSADPADDSAAAPKATSTVASTANQEAKSGSAGTDRHQLRAAAAALDALEDARLVALARAEDTSAREVLYRRHARFALNLAARLQGSAEDIEDIAHDAFMRAFTRLAELREPAAFRSWLGTIVVHLVRTRLRRRKLLRTLGILGGGEAVDIDAVASADARPDQRAQVAQVYALLLTLPADERIAWTLRNVERHRLEDVAQLADCSLATAKRRIARAQSFLAHHFVPPEGGGS